MSTEPKTVRLDPWRAPLAEQPKTQLAFRPPAASGEPRTQRFDTAELMSFLDRVAAEAAAEQREQLTVLGAPTHALRSPIVAARRMVSVPQSPAAQKPLELTLLDARPAELEPRPSWLPPLWRRLGLAAGIAVAVAILLGLSLGEGLPATRSARVRAEADLSAAESPHARAETNVAAQFPLARAEANVAAQFPLARAEANVAAQFPLARAEANVAAQFPLARAEANVAARSAPARAEANAVGAQSAPARAEANAVAEQPAHAVADARKPAREDAAGAQTSVPRMRAPKLEARPRAPTPVPPFAARKAVDLLLSGQTRAALDAYRALSLHPAAPPVLRELVRLLERELRECEEGGASCPS